MESMVNFYGDDTGELNKHELMHEANETYLFHGTKVCCRYQLLLGAYRHKHNLPQLCLISSTIQTEVVELIEKNGIDERFGQLNGLFGAGNYFAENASKVKSTVRSSERDEKKAYADPFEICLLCVHLV